MRTGSTLVAQCITDEHRRILFIDDAYLELIGRSRAESLGRDCLSFTAAPDLRRNNTLLATLQTGGDPFSITKRYVRPDRSTIKVTNHVSAVRDGAGPVRLLATCRPEPDPRERDRLSHNRRVTRLFERALATGKQAFGADLLGAPAFEILLTLYLAEIEGRLVRVRDVCDSSGQPETVARRWLRLLVQRGDVELECSDDLTDATPLRIGVEALVKVEAMLNACPETPR